ncbi:FAS1-like dehydratase domain-containing protein [Mycolicibacterium goodii]|uniref:MaoC family dehydratase N-terminal domain-containing protein n=1 Tax=Mycolicibacterium goodii TaxID=134601 RepID=A0ABS6HIG5_MYCGD|nr:MaoC family dehydratase N-terminal domain-containing protein [Mycolicibacterium goodii]MBU8822452.1 MaoC family dehydratase N-terminal domain-containing protein [Mycolicibacterium goodii]MBU8835275.1 MaoC family dehydratase N-terminal domain-containing protein [Mycolicibacterium goodii]
MDSALTATGLDRFLTDWSPGPTITEDILSGLRLQQLAATLDIGEQFADGDPVPPLWHWVFFLDWPPSAELGADGHPRDGHFLPPIPNRRRMFAGGRLTVRQPLRVGHPAQRESRIASTALKRGRSGELLFVTVRHVYRHDGTVRLVEEQDLVYRSDTGAATPFERADQPLPTVTVPWSTSPQTDPALLFRFSALTGNAHRIHYDHAYATGIEGYPDLVVHGPLLAIYLSELVRAQGFVREFSFKLQRPVFVGDSIRVQGQPDGGTVDLAVVSGAGDVHATAHAVLA